MLLQLPSGAEFYLDGLVLETILLNLRAADLAHVCLTCRALSQPAQAAARGAAQLLLTRLQTTRMREMERGSATAQTRDWLAGAPSHSFCRVASARLCSV